MAVTNTEILAATTAAANSSSVAIDAGGSATLVLRGNSGVGDCGAEIQVSWDGGTTWESTGYRMDSSNPCVIVDGPGTYRVTKGISSLPVGVTKMT